MVHLWSASVGKLKTKKAEGEKLSTGTIVLEKKTVCLKSPTWVSSCFTLWLCPASTRSVNHPKSFFLYINDFNPLFTSSQGKGVNEYLLKTIWKLAKTVQISEISSLFNQSFCSAAKAGRCFPLLCLAGGRLPPAKVLHGTALLRGLEPGRFFGTKKRKKKRENHVFGRRPSWVHYPKSQLFQLFEGFCFFNSLAYLLIFVFLIWLLFERTQC